MTAAKDAGTRFETDLVDWFRGKGYDADRLARAGKNDEGDLVVRAREFHLVLEAKVRRDKTTGLSLGEWINEADTEATNYAEARQLHVSTFAALVVKRVRKGVDKSFVVMELSELETLIGLLEGS